MISGKTVTILSFFAVALIMNNSVSAIGISPSRVDINFEPGFSETYDFYVRAGTYGNIRILSKCELSEYIKPSIENISVRPGEVIYFTVTVELPDEIEKPGKYRCGIIAEEIPVGKTSGVVAYSAVETPIEILVPYPQKYLEVSLHAPNVDVSQPVDFLINLVSMGLEDVTAYGIIRVTDIDGMNMATIYTEPKILKSRETDTLEAVWETTGVSPGKYYATATVEYGGDKPAESTIGLKIGDMLIKIINVTYPEEINPDDIVRFSVEVDSYWNSEIIDAHITLYATSEGTPVGSSTSETFNIEAWDSRIIPIFWDTSDLDIGEYDIKFTAYYSDRTTEKDITVEIIEQQNPYLILILIAVIVAILVIIIYLLKKKYKQNKKKGELNV